MKKSIGAVFGLAIAAAPAFVLLVSPSAPVQAQSASASNVCLTPDQVRNTEVKDARTIVFHMRDGKTWENKLAAPCSDLALGTRSYSQEINSDKICANTQHITVSDTGQVCRLGNFTRVN